MSEQYIESKATVHLFGREYSLKGDVEPSYMLELTKYVNNKIDSIKQNIYHKDELKIALLVALNLADEVFQLKNESQPLEYQNKLNEMEVKTQHLISMLESSLIGENSYVNSKNNFDLNVA